ncbi:MAG: hypothetical protein EPN86_02795, partial [Nanoarchaeota archaeon]
MPEFEPVEVYETEPKIVKQQPSLSSAIGPALKIDKSGKPIKSVSDEDKELEEVLSKHKAQIKVVGCGGGGNNTITRMAEVGIEGVETIAINTDAQDLLYTTADRKILIGKELTKGLGAGSNPKIGEEAARENDSEIKASMQGANMIFVT